MSWNSRLDELVSEGYLRKVTSECGRLVLWNYTDKCTYDRHWNHSTLNARGTVYEQSTGRVVARAFPKFFNFSELTPVEQSSLSVRRDLKVWDKADGSLGIVYYYDGQWRVNTRGSFTSEQAQYAQSQLLPKYDFSKVPTTTSLMCEIIYPENRIIVDYGNTEKLVLLSAYDNLKQSELYPWARRQLSEWTGIEEPKKYEFNTVQEVIDSQHSLPASEEGYVVEFGHGNRVKFKSLEYLKVAKVMSQSSLLGLWQSFQLDGTIDNEFLQAIPEEFRTEIDASVARMEGQYTEVAKELFKDADTIVGMEKREIGLSIKEGNHDLLHPGAAFALKDGNSERLHSYILKLIKPSGNKWKEI